MVWEWPEASTTWRLDDPDDDPGAEDVVFVKVARAGRYPTPEAEAARMRWATAYLPVPEVIESGSDADIGWLVTRAVPGIDATKHPWRAEPERLVPALAAGLAAFHAAAPVDSCPFDFRPETALANARRRVREGIAEPSDLHPEHQHFGVDGALAELERTVPAPEHLVVGHGDYCLPNVMLGPAGDVTGYVDLGELAVVDRWSDIAVGAWSVTWNLGEGWEPLFYEAYGVAPDEQRIAFYRLLYDLTS